MCAISAAKQLLIALLNHLLAVLMLYHCAQDVSVSTPCRSGSHLSRPVWFHAQVQVIVTSLLLGEMALSGSSPAGSDVCLISISMLRTRYL